MLGKITLLISIAAFTSADILENPTVTDFGVWGEFENCSDGFLVTGFQLKIEEYRRRPDNTALNAIKLFCGNVIFKTVEEISSARGPYGRYRKPRYCSGYATGFQLKSQLYQGRNKDDVAAVNVKLICSEGNELVGYKEPNEGRQFRNASYTDVQMCEDGYALCGIQTQVEPPQGLGDDTSLNNLRVKCCPIPGFSLITTTTTSPDVDEEGEEATEEPSELITVATDATTEKQEEIATAEAVTEATTEKAEEIVAAEIVTDATTEKAEEIVTAEVVTDATTQKVEEIVVPEEVTDATTEKAEDIVTAEAVTDATTEKVEEIVTAEVVTDATTENPEEIITAEAVTDATTEKAEEIVPAEVVTDATEKVEEIVTSEVTQVPEIVTEQPTTEAAPQAVTDEDVSSTDSD